MSTSPIIPSSMGGVENPTMSTACAMPPPLHVFPLENSFSATNLSSNSETRPLRSLQSFIPQRKRRTKTTTGATNVAKAFKKAQQSRNKPKVATLDSWQETFVQFLTKPAIHRYLRTGRPIPLKKLCLPSRRGSAIRKRTSARDPLPPAMIRMNSTACVSFDNNMDTLVMGRWIEGQRQTHHEGTETAPIDLSPGNFDRGMEEQYLRMEQTFRKELLSMIGVDMAKKADKPSIVYPDKQKGENVLFPNHIEEI